MTRALKVNLLENPNDSINFAPGHVTLRITSQDGKSERMYTVKLNVHKVVADSLTWTGVAGGRLPGATVQGVGIVYLGVDQINRKKHRVKVRQYL